MYVCCRCTFVAITIAILAMTCVSGVTSSTPCNQFDQGHDFVCPSGKPIVSVSGHHNNWKEDRIYCYGCQTASRSTTDCYDTGYVNEFDATLNTQCAPNYYLSGVWSYHDNGKEDRRFAFRCCKVSGLCTRNCYFDGPVNEYDGNMNYNLKTGQVIVGAYSIHDNYRQ